MLETIPVLVELVEQRKETIEKLYVVAGERGIVEMIPDEISRPAHLLSVTDRSGIRQLSLVGSRARFGMEDREPASGGLTMRRQRGIILLALDLVDE